MWYGTVSRHPNSSRWNVVLDNLLSTCGRNMPVEVTPLQDSIPCMNSRLKKPEITGWWSYLRAVLIKPSWEFITTGTVITALYGLTWWRDNTAPKAMVERWDIRRILPHWAPWVWLCVGQGILIYLAVHESFDLWRQQQGTIDQLRQPEPLPETAPQVSLRPVGPLATGDPVPALVLSNISTNENLYNLMFQVVRHPTGIHILWWPQSQDILRAGQGVTIAPMTFVKEENDKIETYSGLPSLQSVLVEKGVKAPYNIGPIAFSCEDSRQNRYLVSFTASLNQSGTKFTVLDIDRQRIGSRPSIRVPQP
jgi:hypothetical protein